MKRPEDRRFIKPSELLEFGDANLSLSSLSGRFYPEGLMKPFPFSPLDKSSRLPQIKPRKSSSNPLYRIETTRLKWLADGVIGGGALGLLPSFTLPKDLHFAPLHSEKTFHEPERDLAGEAKVSLSQVVINSTCKTAFKSFEARGISTLSQFTQEAYRRFLTTLPLTVIFKIQKEMRDNGADPFTAILVCSVPSATMRSFQEIVLEIKKRKIPLTKELLNDCAKAILPKYLLPEFIANTSMLVIRESDNFFDALTSAFLASLINGPLNLYKDDFTKKYVETKVTESHEATKQADILKSFKNIGPARIANNIVSACITAVVFCGVSTKFLGDIFKEDKKADSKPQDGGSQDYPAMLLHRQLKEMPIRRVFLLPSAHHNIGLKTNPNKDSSQEQPCLGEHQDIIDRFNKLRECVELEDDRDVTNSQSTTATQNDRFEELPKNISPTSSPRDTNHSKVLQTFSQKSSRD